MAKRKYSKRNRKSSARKLNQGQPASPPVGRAAAKQEAAELVGLGNARLDAGDYEEAITYYELAIAADRNTALSYHNRGNVATAYRKRGDAKANDGDHDRARGDYERAYKLTPVTADRPAHNPRNTASRYTVHSIQNGPRNEAEFYYNRGNADLRAGNHDSAIEHYNRAIRLNPDYTKAYGNRGIAKRRQGDYDGAIVDYERALALDPTYWRARENKKAAEELRDGRIDFILDSSDVIRHTPLDPKDANVFLERGNVMMEEGNNELAIADYDRAIGLDPDLVDAYIYRGTVKWHLQDYEAAMADYSHAITLDPNRADIWYSRGTAKLANGDFSGAIVDFEQAIVLDPNHESARHNLALVEMAQDSPENPSPF